MKLHWGNTKLNTVLDATIKGYRYSETEDGVRREDFVSFEKPKIKRRKVRKMYGISHKDVFLGLLLFCKPVDIDT